MNLTEHIDRHCLLPIYINSSVSVRMADSLCVQPLGMKSGRIKESQLFSSSFYKETHTLLGRSPHQARLGGAGYWSPVGGHASIDSQQFLQIAFETPIQLKMVSTQSRSNKGLLL